jgi:hypothetical protein
MNNFNKTALVLAVSLGGALASALPSLAQSTPAASNQTTFASITGISDGASTSSNVFTYTPGVGGGFSISPNALFSSEYVLSPISFAAPVNVSFTGLNNVGTLTGGPANYQQALSGGSFAVTSGGTSLLTGTFDGGNLLDGTVGASTSTITNTLTNVTFTGGSYFSQSGLFNPGSFSLSMTSVAPPISAGATYFNGFTAGGTGTFSASTIPPAVPEPATAVPFVLGGLGLLALIVRKNRRASSVTA